jgi:large subunit ribosomal protein L2
VAALTLLGVGSLLRGAVTRYSGGKPVAAPGIRILRPKTNARRNMSVPTYEEITEKRVYKPLAKHYQQAYARNKNGKRLLQCRGAVKTHTKLYRTIDFSRRKRNMFGTVMSIEYDPFRNARICRVKYEDGENRYVLWCMGMFVGQTIISAEDAPPFVGNAMPMKNVPNGTQICNFEEKPGLHTSAYARAAGTFGTVLSKDRGFVCVKMPSTEIKLFYDKCWCTVGRIGRIEHFLIKLGKADVTRHMGFRPRVRGKAKNACDHPHGGGEGRSSIGHRFRCTPKGKNRFARTRPRSLYSNRFILQRALTRRRKNMQK